MAFSSLLIILASLFFLWIGSQLLISGIIKISNKSGLTRTFVGVTALSICTNLPEILISYSAAWQQLHGVNISGLVIGNVVGSNISQITLVIGLVGLTKSIKVEKKILIKHGLVLLLSTTMFLIFSRDGLISRSEGLFMIILYLGYFSTLESSTAQSMLKAKILKIYKNKRSSAILSSVVGAITMILASHYLVIQMLSLSEILGITQTLLGIFLVGLGISLPDLFVIVGALKRNSASLSLGTLLGSNVVAILIALGSSAALVGWNVERQVAMFDLPFLLLATVIFLLFLFTRTRLDKKESLLLIALYVIYATLKALGF